MTASKYKESRIECLVNYAKSKGFQDQLGGHWQNSKKEYDYILKYDNTLDAILRYNILDGVPPDLFRRPHSYSHHLNSSQVLCYNYFRPMISPQRAPLKSLCDLLLDIVELPYSAECDFEIKSLLGDNTEYDFFIKDFNSDLEISFEIKYTEYGFGPATGKTSDEKYETLYKGLLVKCACIKDNVDKENFFKYYQLFRNVLHVTDTNKYAIFIFPKSNDACKNEFDRFLEMIHPEYRSNIRALYWEDLMIGQENTDFFVKYFKIYR